MNTPPLALLLLSCRTDTAPPTPPPDAAARLEVDTQGFFHDDRVTVQGTAAGLTDVTVSGREAFRNGDAFQAEVPLQRGVNTLVVRGVDRFGDPHVRRHGVLSGEWGAPDALVADAVSVRLNQGGIDAATGIAVDLLLAADLPGLLTGAGPVYQGSYSVAGFEAGSISASVADVGFTRPVLALDPRAGEIELLLSIPNFQVELQATGQAIGISFDQDVTLSAAVIDLHADVALAVGPGGQLQVEVGALQLALLGFDFDVESLPDAIEGFFVEQVRGVIEDNVVASAQDLLPGLLDDALADLALAYSTQLLDRAVAVEGELQAITIDPLGIQLTSGVRLQVERAGTTTAPGYLAAPLLPAQPSLLDDLSATLSDNLLNNVLFQAWRAGLLELELGSADGSLDPALLSQLGARGAATVRVRADTPPVLVERDGAAVIEITELAVRVETPGGDNGEYLDLAVTAAVGVGLQVQQGVLALDLQQPTVSVEVRGSDWGAADDTLTNLLAEQLPIDALLLLLGQIEVPLPSIPGVPMPDAQAFRDATGFHTAIGANL